MDERHFRRMKEFTNKVEDWKQWRTHFLTAVRESDLKFAKTMEAAEESEKPLTAGDMTEEQIALSGTLYARLIGITSKQSFTMVESTQGNGLEAWRLMAHRFNPTTYARFVSLILQLVKWKVTRNGDVQSGILQWESLLSSIERDHKVEIPVKLKAAFLLNILPGALHRRLYEHIDRLETYGDLR